MRPPATGYYPGQARVLDIKRTLAMFTVFALVFAGLTFTSAAHAADKFEGRDLLYRTHVDAAHLAWEGGDEDGHFIFQVIDGHTPRNPDEVFVRLGPDADFSGKEVSRIKVPYEESLSFLGKPGDIVWFAPQQLLDGWAPVWAGFGTGELPQRFLPETVEMELVDGGGPGDVEVYTTSRGKAASRLFSSKDPRFKRYPMEPGAHAHVSWSFTKSGRYDTKWRAHARTRDGQEVTSDTFTVSWLVGTDKELGIPEGTYKGALIMQPAESFDIGQPPATPGDDNQPQPGDGSGATPTPGEGESPTPGEGSQPAPGEEQPAPFDPLAYNPTKDMYKCVHIAEGHLDLRAKVDEDDYMSAFLRHDLPGGGHEDLGSSQAVIEVPEPAKVTVGDGPESADLAKIVGTGEVYELPEIQQKGVPWTGFNTEDLDYTDNLDTVVKIESFEGPKSASMALGHYDVRERKYVVDLDTQHMSRQVWRLNQPTHVHPSIVFSHPGYYRVEYTIAYEKTTGARNYDFFTVFYAVGKDAINNACERDGKEVAEQPGEGDTTPAPEQPAPEQPGDDTKPAPGDEGSTPAPEQPEPTPAPEQPAPEEPKPAPNPGDEGATPAPEQPAPTPVPVKPAPEKPSPLKPEPAPKPAPGPEKPAPAPTPKPAPAPNNPDSERVILEKGHTDAFYVVVENGELKLKLKEDITGHEVIRNGEDVELHVKSAAKMDVPAGWPGAGNDRYVLPQSADPNLLWPGWDTLPVAGTEFDGKVDLIFEKVEGPGQVYLFANQLGKPAPLLKDGQTELKTGSVREQSFPAHTHANWIFTKPGVYTLTLKANGSKKGEAVSSNTVTYTFTVGDEYRGKAQQSKPLPGEGTPLPEQPAPLPVPLDPKEPAPVPAPVKPQPNPGVQQPGDGSEKPGDQPGKPGEEPNQPANPGDEPVKPGDEAKKPGADTKPGTEPKQPGHEQGNAPAAPTTGGGLSEVVNAGAPTASSAVPEKQICQPSEEVRAATKAEVARVLSGLPALPGTTTPGSTSSKTSVGVSGSYTIRSNTHVHPNWVFTKPGHYTVGIRQVATAKNGQKLVSNTTLHFNVGSGATGITDGHFDLGSQVQGGNLIPALKDDRSAPAKWVSPSSLTFALNDRAKVTAPAGLEFIAPAGSQVYMIPSAQIAGVPWLGANTMDESLQAGTTGDVTWTLTSVAGPGDLAVFTSGNFGTLVGQRWFGSKSTTTTVTTPGTTTPGKAAGLSSLQAKDPAKANVGEVFLVDGKPMIKTVVGKTASGEACDLPAQARGNLPRTGADVAPLAGLAALFMATGAAGIILRRRQIKN